LGAESGETRAISGARLSLVSAAILSNASTPLRPTGATMPNSARCALPNEQVSRAMEHRRIDMAQNQKNRTDLLKSVKAWLLAVLLVLALGAAFYQMGLGVIGLLIGIVIVLRLFGSPFRLPPR
jgi:hypothetical protein